MRRTLVVLALLSACSPAPERPRSAVLVTIDTTSPSALGCYGQAAPVTPHLDRLARESLVYDDARTVAPLTLPSHASMLTGLYPLRHTVHDNGRNPLPAAAETLAERAGERGFQTAAFVAAVVLAEPFGLAQGFDTYVAPEGSRAPGGRSELRGGEITERALAWLEERDPERPFFLWVHYFDPHAQYRPERRFVERINPSRDVPFAGYLGEVAQADEAIGRLFDALAKDGTLGETYLVVVADHGEALGAHGELTHSLLIYDATIRVPLLIRDPAGHRAGERSDETVSVADVYPTLVDALALGDPGPIDGESLFRRRVPPERGVYYESFSAYLTCGWSPLTGWADRHGTYLHGSRPELFAADDRRQQHDRYPARGDRAEAALERIAACASRPALASGESVDDELAEAVRDLGYLGSNEGPGAGGRHPLDPFDPFDTDGRRSPRDGIDEWSAVFEAAQLGAHGKLKRAVRKLEEHLADEPGHTLAIETLCTLLARMNRHDRVIDVLAPRAATGLERHLQVVLLGSALEHEERFAEAADVYARAAERWPDEPDFRAGLERVRARLGD